jgi:ubiquinone/menaquinone biosynthesis C-methylase UbiE
MNKSYLDLDLKYFNKYEDGYFPYSEKDLNRILDEIAVKINELKEAKICEVGCGSGQFSSELSKKLNNKYEFYGIDISEVILDYYPFYKIHASAFEIPLNPSFFDVICYPASLHHLFPFEKAVKEMDRVLKPQGIFYCIEPNFYHPQRFLLMQNKFIYHLFRKANDVPIKFGKLFTMLAEKGYTLIYKEYLNIEFKEYSFLQSLQNKISSTILARKFPQIFQPWFILIAQKGQKQ